MARLEQLQKTIGVSFHDPSLLEQALVHSSYVNENPGLALDSNERLEFLGDAVIGLIIAGELFRRFPDLSEGEMTKLRASVVRRDTLYRLAKRINLGKYLRLGKGEEASEGRDKPANLASALEAITGAIFLDQGLEVAREFILRLASEELGKGAEADYKSRLQEFLQAKGKPRPIYQVVAMSGPEHERTFTVEVRIGDKVLGRGKGKNKKAAETEAARSALARLQTNFTP